MKYIHTLIQDHIVQLSALNAGIMLSAMDWGIKIAFGLPSAIYITLKIYHDFIKPARDKKIAADDQISNHKSQISNL